MQTMMDIDDDTVALGYFHHQRRDATGFTALIQNEDGTNPTTVKQCRERATQIGGIKVVGVRTKPDPIPGQEQEQENKGTCFGYDDVYKNYIGDDAPRRGGTDDHYMTCLDPSKRILKGECYQKPPSGFSMGGGYGRF
mgnify:FL=1